MARSPVAQSVFVEDPPPKGIPGTKVKALAHFVVHESEARRFFGAKCKTQYLPGTVVSFEYRVGKVMKVGYVTADFTLPGNKTKRKVLATRSIVLAPESDPIHGEPATWTSVENLGNTASSSAGTKNEMFSLR